MADLTSTKPYMLRAMHEWCVDNNLTPHLLVAVNAQTRVPKAFVKEGEIVLNLSYSATKDLQMDNDAVVFSARFSGVSQNLYVPMSAVKGIFVRENGQGMMFEAELAAEADDSAILNGFKMPKSAEIEQPAESEVAKPKKKPTLTIVK